VNNKVVNKLGCNLLILLDWFFIENK